MGPAVPLAFQKDDPRHHFIAFSEGDGLSDKPAHGMERLSSPFLLLSTNSSCLIAPILQTHSRLVSPALCSTELLSGLSPHRFLPSINSCSCLGPSIS